MDSYVFTKKILSHHDIILQRDYYRDIRNGVWDITWQIVHSDGWKLCSGKDCETGVVFSKHYKEYGKIFRLEVSMGTNRVKMNMTSINVLDYQNRVNSG